jgi:Flp pilus assembly protein TadD
MHAEVGLIKTMIANVKQAIDYVKKAAEQLPKIDRWRVLLGYICARITRKTVLPSPPPALAGAG